MQFVSLLLLTAFFLVELLSAFIGAQFIYKQVTPLVEEPSDPLNSIYFFAYILVSALVLLIILKYYKGKKLFYYLELFLLFASLFIFFALFFSNEIAFFLAVFLVLLRVLLSFTKNFFMLFICAVIGAFLGYSLDLLPAVLLAVFLSAYDLVAVFFTKHMIKLAQQLSEREASFSVKAVYRKQSLELGTGDFLIPSMLLVSSLKISVVQAAAVSLGSLIGLFLLFYFLEKKGGYWPALPPIVSFSLLFLSLSFLIK